MYMQMGNGLPGVLPAIGYDAETRFRKPCLFRDIRRCQKQTRKKSTFHFVGFQQIIRVLFGDYNNMNRRLRVNIVKGEDQIIFIYNFGRYLPFGDFAKNAAVQRFSPLFTKHRQ